MTDPLTGLCPRLVKEMSEEELRQQVMLTQQFRQSFQTFKAEVEKAEEVEGKAKRVKREAPKPASAKDLDDLLS